MPDIAVGNQVFDVAFHPREDVVLAGLLTGEIKAFAYTDDGAHEAKWDLRPTKRSCRGLAFDYAGERVYAVSKDRTVQCVVQQQGIRGCWNAVLQRD